MKQYLIRGNVDPAAAEIAWEQELFSFAHASREERQNAKKWFGHLCELKESFSELHKIIDRVMLASRVAKFNPLARSELKYRRGEFEDQLEKIDGLVKRY